MKIKCIKQDLLNALTIVQNIVNLKSNLPILANVLIETESDSIVLTTTDLELGIRTKCPADIRTPGSITIPVKKLYSIIKELPLEDIEIEVGDNYHVNIMSGVSYFRIMGLSKDDFPKLPELSHIESFALSKDFLAYALRRTSIAISSDENRYILNGVLLGISKKKVTVVSTDVKRLAVIETEADISETVSCKVIIPAKAVNELYRLLNGKGSVTVRVTANQISFEIDDILFITRLIEGNFPDYRQFIPKRVHDEIRLPKNELCAALKRVSLVTTEKANSVKFSFTKNKLILTSNSPEVGEAREEMAIPFEKDDCQITFNPAFIIDMLKSVDEENIYLHYIDGLNPGIMRSDEHFVYVVMPMRMTDR